MHKYALFVGIIGTAATLVTSAMANVRVYPASFCVEESDTAPEISYDTGGGGFYAENVAAGTNSWLCPIVRDDESGGVEDWDITVNRNGNTADSWDVILYSLNRKGDSGYSDTISVPATSGTQHLDGDPVASFESGGQLSIRTAIPAGVRLHLYSIDE